MYVQAGGRKRGPRGVLMRALRHDAGHHMNHLIQATKVLECRGRLGQTTHSTLYMAQSTARIRELLELGIIA